MAWIMHQTQYTMYVCQWILLSATGIPNWFTNKPVKRVSERVTDKRMSESQRDIPIWVKRLENPIPLARISKETTSTG